MNSRDYRATWSHSASRAGDTRLRLLRPAAARQGTGVPGISSTILAGDTGLLTAVSISLTFSPAHSWAGDLTITLSNGSVTATILQRPGKTSAASGAGDSSNLAGPYTFIDTGADIAAALADIDTNAVLASGSYRASNNVFNGNVATTNPFVSLNSLFGGQPSAATWTLRIVDGAAQDTGTLTSWSLTLTTADGAVPEPSTFALTGLGLSALGLLLRRRR